jgi:hypothetical protein
MKERKKDIKDSIRHTRRVDDWFKENKSQKYFINCDWVPCVVENMKKDCWDVDITGISMSNGQTCSCSALSCNPQFVDKEYAEKLITLYNTSKRDYYKELHGLDESDMDKFMEQMAEFNREWR